MTKTFDKIFAEEEDARMAYMVSPEGLAEDARINAKMKIEAEWDLAEYGPWDSSFDEEE